MKLIWSEIEFGLIYQCHQIICVSCKQHPASSARQKFWTQNSKSKSKKTSSNKPPSLTKFQFEMLQGLNNEWERSFLVNTRRKKVITSAESFCTAAVSAGEFCVSRHFFFCVVAFNKILYSEPEKTGSWVPEMTLLCLLSFVKFLTLSITWHTILHVCVQRFSIYIDTCQNNTSAFKTTSAY